jgi:hypothetical protein
MTDVRRSGYKTAGVERRGGEGGGEVNEEVNGEE